MTARASRGPALLVCLLAVSLQAQTPAAPTGLKATSASKSAVALSWTASSGASTYAVERRALGGTFAALGSQVATTTFTDSGAGLDPFQTYSYRVRAVAGSAVSTPSNEIVVGPPPIGFNIASATPSGVTDAAQYGRQVSLALDASGDPVLAFLYLSPSETGLYFVGWDRASYRWKAPVKVDVLGTINLNGALREVSIAADAFNSTLGIAYAKGGFGMQVAFSTDGGATWKSQAVPATGTDEAIDCSLALAGGQAYLLFANGGLVYFSGSETAAPSAWTKQTVPLFNGADGYRLREHLALDSAGKPGVAYLATLAAGGLGAGFWRPGSASAVKTADTKGLNTDDPDLRLSFAGTNPRIAMFGQFDNGFFDYGHQVWVNRSTDGGTTWSTPVNLPADGNSSMAGPVSIASTSTGGGAVTATRNGGNSGGVKCGEPKLSLSTDLVNWTTCSPQGSGFPRSNADFINAVYAANDKLYLAYLNGDPNNSDIATGVIVWREPVQSGALPAPVVNTGGVVNAASNQAGAAVAAGSIISIYGSNLSSTAAGAGAGDLPLPTNILGTSVTINGIAAPLYYVSLNQINAQLPFEIATGTASLSVSVNGAASPAVTFNVAAAGPGIFLYSGTRAVVQNPGGSINAANTPAKPGDVCLVYMTGQGALDNPVPTGGPALVNPLSRAKLPVTATVGGKDAPVDFAGLTPGLVGLLQVNFHVPSLPNGDYPLIVTIGGVASNQGTMSVGGN